MPTLTSAVERTRELARAARALEGAGWAKVRTFSFVRLTKAGTDPNALLGELALNGAESFDRITATGSFGDASLVVAVGSDGSRVVLDRSATDPRALFGAPDLAAARLAWEGDASAALSLPGSWTVSVEQDLAGPLRDAEPAVAWTVLPTEGDLDRLLSDRPVWSLGFLVDAEKPHILLVECLTDDDDLALPRAAVLGLIPASVVAHVQRLVDGAGPRGWEGPELPEAASPVTLRPVARRGVALASVESRLWQAAATMAWIVMSTDARVAPDAKSVTVEVFGLQRVTHRVAAGGLHLAPGDAVRTLEMFLWATGPEAIDQLLAVQQVASLYRDPDQPPWAKTADVFEAARAVFASLRRDAVAEVLVERRSARLFAIEAAQRTTEHVSALARATVERVVATIVAIGGVVVGQSADVLSQEQAGHLRLLVAVALWVLSLWCIVVESPPLRAPLTELRDDLPIIASTLTSRECTAILELASVRGARRRSVAVQWAAPGVLVLASIAALTGR